MANDPTADLIRRNLVKFREELELSQPKVADRAGIAVDNLRRYEQGTRNIDAITLQHLAAALGHEIGHFFMDDPPPADLALVPPFIFRPTDGIDVDQDLIDEMKKHLDDVMAKHLQRVRARNKKKRKS